MILPPGVSAGDFSAAISQFEAAVGKAWVFTSDEDVALYRDAYSPLWGEKDEKKRIEGWKAADKYIAEQGYVIPLLQYVQPVVYKADLKVVPNTSGALQPTLVSNA